MLAEQRRGAHQARYLVEPSPEVIEGWSRSSGVRVATLAPELPGADAIIRELVERGVVVSAGHSDATHEEAMKAFDAGIRSGTHLFNAMRPFHHRDPGLAGALLAHPRARTSLIADGVHVHPDVVAAAWRAKGTGGLALVTDAISAMGTEGTAGSLGDQTVSVDGGIARSPEGRLAGSMLTLDQAVRNLVAWAECPAEEAIATVTSTPAAILGEDRRGRIEPGGRGDLVLLDPDLSVVAAVVGGRVVFDDRGRQGIDP
jgi:N-acetylglucosamine-6-phosphate deacetylase